MANPAELLYNNLFQRNPPNLSTQTTPANFRQLSTNRDHALRMHEIAIRCIAQIRELLDTLNQLTGVDVDEYRRELPNWTAIVLAYPNGWQAAEQFNDTSMRFLKTLGTLLKGLVPSYTDEDINKIADGLSELLELLSKDKTLSRELAIYLLNLINHVRWVLHDYHLRGDFEVARAVTLLRDSLRTASEFTADQELKPWYKKLLGVFARKDVVVNALEMGTAAAKALSAMEALPPGGGLG